ncbi:hypothetical protein SNEBB_005822 [Seison nebaliae]|nr:hypothetical protein SNEBB_005822 [Seison nebaliae]
MEMTTEINPYIMEVMEYLEERMSENQKNDFMRKIDLIDSSSIPINGIIDLASDYRNGKLTENIERYSLYHLFNRCLLNFMFCEENFEISFIVFLNRSAVWLTRHLDLKIFYVFLKKFSVIIDNSPILMINDLEKKRIIFKDFSTQIFTEIQENVPVNFEMFLSQIIKWKPNDLTRIPIDLISSNQSIDCPIVRHLYHNSPELFLGILYDIWETAFDNWTNKNDNFDIFPQFANLSISFWTLLLRYYSINKKIFPIITIIGEERIENLLEMLTKGQEMGRLLKILNTATTSYNYLFLIIILSEKWLNDIPIICNELKESLRIDWNTILLHIYTLKMLLKEMENNDVLTYHFYSIQYLLILIYCLMKILSKEKKMEGNEYLIEKSFFNLHNLHKKLLRCLMIYRPDDKFIFLLFQSIEFSFDLHFHHRLMFVDDLLLNELIEEIKSIWSIHVNDMTINHQILIYHSLFNLINNCQSVPIKLLNFRMFWEKLKTSQSNKLTEDMIVIEMNFNIIHQLITSDVDDLDENNETELTNICESFRSLMINDSHINENRQLSNNHHHQTFQSKNGSEEIVDDDDCILLSDDDNYCDDVEELLESAREFYRKTKNNRQIQKNTLKKIISIFHFNKLTQ